jgi:hypothetical protein
LKLQKTSRCLVGLLSLTCLALACHAGEVLDRIVATVNNHVILLSDWKLALSYQAFLEDRRVPDLSPAERKASLDHLIDGELIRQQLRPSDFGDVSTEELKGKIQQIRREKIEDASDSVWLARLAQFGLTERELESKVRDEIEQMRAVEARLRPGIQVDERSIAVYYNEKFLPQLLQSGSKVVPLESVAPQIKELLAQQRLNEFLISWLHSLRNESTIHTPFDSASSGGGS